MKTCISCGMPLKDKNNIAFESDIGPVCIHCATEDKKVKPCKEIFNGGVEFFLGAIPNISKEFTEKIKRKDMKMQIYWKDKDERCLKGEEATDKEFEEAMSKMKF